MPKASSVPSVLDPRCPSRLVLDRIADKWTALVIQILAGGTMRYAALQREIGGISQKMLTQTLRSLERDGLVQRTVHPVVPPKVEYSLTKLGRTLIEPLQGLCRWSEKHLGELQANRARAKAVAAGVDRGKLRYFFARPGSPLRGYSSQLTHAPGRDYCAFVHGRWGSGRAGAQDYAAVSDRARPWRTRFEFRAAIAGGEPESGRCVLLHSSGANLSCCVVHIVA